MVNESPFMGSHLTVATAGNLSHKHINCTSRKNTIFMVITSLFEAILSHLEIPDLKEVNKSPEVISLLKRLGL